MTTSRQYISLILVLGFFFNGFSQKNINDYKYVVVPTKFDFVDAKDKYRMNTLTRYLFKENGFLTFFDEEKLPEDLFKDRCLAMYANVKETGGSLSTKVQIELIDCQGNLIFISDEGRTKIKSYAKAYQIAIREAFESVKFLDYKYQPSVVATGSTKKGILNAPDANSAESQVATESAAEIKRLKEELNVLKENQEKTKTLAEEVVVQEENVQSNVESVIPDKVIELKSERLKKVETVLTATPIDNGFKVMDYNSKEVMILLYSGAPDVYNVKGEDALVFKKGNVWMYSVNDGSGVTVKQINLKF